MQLEPKYYALEELLERRLFRIPEYQRAYSWETKQRKDLFDDITKILQYPIDRHHFMATVVCLNTNKKEEIGADEFTTVNIVDGQQRLTTLIVILKTISKQLDQKKHQEKDLRKKLSELLVKGDKRLILLQTNHDSYRIFTDLRKSLVGNKGFRKYLKIEKGSASIDERKIEYESRFDGKWVLTTNTDLTSEEVALKYKELWRVEKVFRDVKSLLDTRPIFHKRDATIRGHVFCSFLALVLRKELDRRLSQAGHRFEWAEIKQDLKALQRVTIVENGRSLCIRSQSKGVCGKIFQAVGVAMPPTIQET